MGRQLCPWMSIGKRLEPLKGPMLVQAGAQKRLCLFGMPTLEWASGRIHAAMKRGFHTGACLLWDSWSNTGPALEQPVPEELQTEKYSRKFNYLRKLASGILIWLLLSFEWENTNRGVHEETSEVSSLGWYLQEHISHTRSSETCNT